MVIHSASENSKEDKLPKYDVGIVGLGYVGLPLAKLALDSNLSVFGFDIDRKLIERISDPLFENNSTTGFHALINGVSKTELDVYIENFTFVVSASESELKNCKVVVICVPTPLNSDLKPDLTSVISASDKVAGQIEANTLVILESTSFPGTTEKIVGNILSEHGFVLGFNCFLGFSSERIDPGNSNFTLRNCPKNLAGVDERSTAKMVDFYSKMIPKELLNTGTNTRVVELSKLIENAYRLINLTFINELSVGLFNTGIDVWEAIDLAANKPFGFQKFVPGPGIGGHCIPVDPVFLNEWLKSEIGILKNNVLSTAIDNLSHKPLFISKTFLNMLQGRKIILSEQEILVLGLTYKKDIPDFRNSPSLEIIKHLKPHVGKITIFDPYLKYQIATLEELFVDSQFKYISTVEEIPENLPTLLLVNHKGLSEYLNVRQFPLLLDTVNSLKGGENVFKI
jgi:UDP-N-acetyl-D-glucosamine dehydrogenase